MCSCYKRAGERGRDSIVASFVWAPFSWYFAVDERQGGDEDVEVLWTGNEVATVVCMLCVILNVLPLFVEGVWIRCLVASLVCLYLYGWATVSGWTAVEVECYCIA